MDILYFLIFIVIFILLPYLLLFFLLKKLCHSLVDNIVEIALQKHEYRESNLSEFPKLNRSFYNKTQRLLETYGFRFIADYEDMATIEGIPKSRVFIRGMLNEDSTIMASIIHARKNIFMNSKILDLSTEFDDSTFIVTNNWPPSAMSISSSMINGEYLPIMTSFKKVIKHHFDKLDKSKKNPLKFSNIEDIFASQYRLNGVKLK